MNSPLARHLTRFSSATDRKTAPNLTLVPAEALVTLTTSELAARLDAERRDAENGAATATELAMSRASAEHAAAMSEALQAARADWAANQAAHFGAQLETALEELRNMLSDRLANVLRPLLARAAVERTLSALVEAVDRLLADPARPAITIRGPADLLDAMKAARGTATGIDFHVIDAADVAMTANGAHVETRLAAALAALSLEAN